MPKLKAAEKKIAAMDHVAYMDAVKEALAKEGFELNDHPELLASWDGPETIEEEQDLSLAYGRQERVRQRMEAHYIKNGQSVPAMYVKGALQDLLRWHTIGLSPLYAADHLVQEFEEYIPKIKKIVPSARMPEEERGQRGLDDFRAAVADLIELVEGGWVTREHMLAFLAELTPHADGGQSLAHALGPSFGASDVEMDRAEERATGDRFHKELRAAGLAD